MKPILTREEVEAEKATLKEAEKTRHDLHSRMFIDGQTQRLDFIEQAVELLRRVKENNFVKGTMPAELWNDILCFLDRYDGTSGKDGE